MASDRVSAASGDGPEDRDQTLRLHVEQVDIARRRHEVAVVRATVRTETSEHLVSEDLAIEHVEITHVPIGRPVDRCPPVRIEGDTTILSIVEEVLVVTRQLVLREEVHMTKMRTTEHHAETVTLRKQRAIVSREPTNR